jgi:hypothetical protein
MTSIMACGEFLSPLIEWCSSPSTTKRKDAGRVLMRFNELRETLQLRLSGELTRFTDDELKAIVRLLRGPGVVWELKFGSWVLFQPGRINAYAQAVIQTIRRMNTYAGSCRCICRWEWARR